MPSSAATSAATIDPTSAIRRCSTSTWPAARSSRRMPRRASTRRGQAVAAPVGLPPERDPRVVVARGREGVGERGAVAPAATRDGDDPLHLVTLPQQGVTELDEQGGDAAGVTLARVAQATVDVAVEEELDDGETVAAHRCRRRCELVGQTQGRDLGQRPARPGHRAEGGSGRGQLGCVVEPRLCEEVPQRREGRSSHDLHLGVVLPDPGEQLRDRGPSHEAQRLHETSARAGLALRGEGRGQPLADGIRGAVRPRLEGALREHRGEPSLGAPRDQRRDSRGLRVDPAERLDRVLGHVLAVVVEEGDELSGRHRTPLGAEGARGGDRGDGVGVGGGGHEQVDGLRAGVPRDVLEPLAGPQPLEDGAGRPHGRERGTDVHGPTLGERHPDPRTGDLQCC